MHGQQRDPSSTGQLSPPAEKGRLSPFPWNVLTSSQRVGPTTSKVYVPDATPSAIRAALARFCQGAGFSVTDNADPYVAMVAHRGRRGVTGQFVAERNMGVDRAAVHRADRIRWIVVLLGAIAAGSGFFELSRGALESPTSLLWAALGPTGMVAAFLGGMNFYSIDLWSDLLIASYEATIADDRSALPMVDRSAAYCVTLTVGRAQSRNQWGQVTGRRLVRIWATPSLDDLREKLVTSFREDWASTPLSAGSIP